jgi:hypothetical protein
VWLKLSQLARRNRMLEQQLAERMQATHLSGTKQPPPAVQQLPAAAAGRSAVAMEVDCRSSGKPKGPVAIIDCRPLPHPSQPVQQQQQQQGAQQRGQQDSSQQQEVQRLQREVQRLQGLNTMLQK